MPHAPGMSNPVVANDTDCGLKRSKSEYHASKLLPPVVISTTGGTATQDLWIQEISATSEDCKHILAKCGWIIYVYLLKVGIIFTSGAAVIDVI